MKYHFIFRLLGQLSSRIAFIKAKTMEKDEYFYKLVIRNSDTAPMGRFHRSHKRANKIQTGGDDWRKSKDLRKNMCTFHNLPINFHKKNQEKYSLQGEFFSDTKESTPGMRNQPSSAQHGFNIPTFYTPSIRVMEKSAKTNDIIPQDVIIVSYDKMASPFFKTTFDSVNYCNRDLLQKILAHSKKNKKFQSLNTQDEQYMYEKHQTPAPNHYSNPSKLYGANSSFFSISEKMGGKPKPGPCPFTYSSQKDQQDEKKQGSSFFTSTTERFPLFLPPHSEYKSESQEVPKQKQFRLNKTSINSIKPLNKSEKSLNRNFDISSIRRSIKAPKDKELKMLSLIEKIHQRRSNDSSLSEALKASVHERSDIILKEKLTAILEKQITRVNISTKASSEHKIGLISSASHHRKCSSEEEEKINEKKQLVLSHFFKDGK